MNNADAPAIDGAAVKKAIREKAHANRNSQPDKDALSDRICETFGNLEEYRQANAALFYIDARSEVRTRRFLSTALNHRKRIAVPYCVDGRLELFHLTSMDELSVGMYRILEPRMELRVDSARRVEVEELDLVMTPGVAFDRRGARMGHGFGYYDKLLAHCRPDAALIALAYECQIFDEIPVQPHDVFMHKIVTEAGVYDCTRNRGA